ncbi:hypothetical protein CNEO4_740037 [Clostridium neonatale]|nr:hypothetical protein CNEO2_250009 [Clostridium neonatale]CAI3653547.1 hypothetical protein CNEO4_420046 [Clostridium neonatale]CAI3663092.1 hypothetical protein CNEO4_420049 [Clostridium neonatale]CAI3663736.1 hypothetical protein CNEO3_440040 [Clostridium neonatale]CAI3715484.1 hypothetical protein CNEO4_740037 [Clostridium neonatale]
MLMKFLDAYFNANNYIFYQNMLEYMELLEYYIYKFYENIINLEVMINSLYLGTLRILN